MFTDKRPRQVAPVLRNECAVENFFYFSFIYASVYLMASVTQPTYVYCRMIGRYWTVISKGCERNHSWPSLRYNWMNWRKPLKISKRIIGVKAEILRTCLNISSSLAHFRVSLVSGLDLAMHNEPGYHPLGWKTCPPATFWQPPLHVSVLPTIDDFHRGKHRREFQST